MVERSPLKYTMTRYVSCLNPEVICSSRDVAIKRLNGCLEKMVESDHASGTDADRVKAEYQQLIENCAMQELLQSFRRNTDRLDDFWNKLMEHY